jgi:ADP-ribose pyrophosphatase YjhB (NUDIX family)
MPSPDQRHPHIKHAALRTIGAGANLAWRVVGNLPHTPARRTRVALLHDNHVLLIKNITDFQNWKLPGGGLHRNEAPRIGAVREVHEELGISLAKSSLALVGEFTDPQRGAVYYYDGFIAQLNERPELTLSWEISHAKWLPLDDLPSNIAPYVLDLLAKRAKS